MFVDFIRLLCFGRRSFFSRSLAPSVIARQSFILFVDFVRLHCFGRQPFSLVPANSIIAGAFSHRSSIFFFSVPTNSIIDAFSHFFWLNTTKTRPDKTLDLFLVSAKTRQSARSRFIAFIVNLFLSFPQIRSILAPSVIARQSFSLVPANSIDHWRLQSLLLVE